MGLTRRREPNLPGNPRTRPIPHWLIFLQGVKVPVVSAHKFLGMLVNQEMCLKEQVKYALWRGTTWVMKYHKLAKLLKGVAAKYMSCFYISVAILKMLYAADLFLVPEIHKGKGTKGLVTKLTKIKRQATL